MKRNVHGVASSKLAPPRRDAMAEPPAGVRSFLRALGQTTADEKVAAMAMELASVRRNVRAVQGQAARSRHPWKPWSTLKFEAALVYELSQETKWAMVLVKMQQRQNLHRSIRMMQRTTEDMILDWWKGCRMTATFADACANINNKSRRKVDVFLVESVLFEHVLRQSERQLLVPSPTIVAKYMTAWSYRPASSWVLQQLAALEQNKYTRHNWVRLFRQRWDITWGLLPASQNITVSEMKTKVRHMSCTWCVHVLQCCAWRVWFV